MFDFAKSRYHNDPAFKSLVDLMTNMIIQHEFTPSEMRSAAIMASINYEMMRIDHRHPRYYIDKEAEEAFATLQSTWDRETGGGK